MKGLFLFGYLVGGGDLFCCVPSIYLDQCLVYIECVNKPKVIELVSKGVNIET